MSKPETYTGCSALSEEEEEEEEEEEMRPSYIGVTIFTRCSTTSLVRRVFCTVKAVMSFNTLHAVNANIGAGVISLRLRNSLSMLSVESRVV